MDGDVAGQVQYYFADHLNSSRIVTDASGTILDDADFYPFGGERTYTSTSGNTYKFTGKERDTESGLDDFGARYYTSQFGRFMTPDWSASPVLVPYADLGNPQTFNLYSYVSNNPLNGIDPDGHFRLDPGGELYTDPDATGCLYCKEAPSEESQQQAQQQQQAAEPQTTTLTVGSGKDAVTVDVTFTPYRSGNASGVEIDIQTKNCDDCRYVQTVSASDHSARVDTERDSGGKPISPSYPLYPSQQKKGEFYDSPQRTDKPSSFTAVVSVGKTDGKSFKSSGSITYGFSLNSKGDMTVRAPRVATKQESAASIAVVQKEVPGYTIK